MVTAAMLAIVGLCLWLKNHECRWFLTHPQYIPQIQVPDYLKPEHHDVIERWLKTHAGFRLATDGDCSCDTEIARLRNGAANQLPIPDYHPYYAVADFNGDGKI